MQKQVELTAQLKSNVNESLTNGDIDTEVTAALQDQTPGNTNQHPNGFDSWYETHFEICYYLLSTEDTPGSMANQTQAGSGRGGLYELSKMLTDEFESKFKGREWDGEYFDEIDKFLDE